jgi:large subunit ribosomal protein L21
MNEQLTPREDIMQAYFQLSGFQFRAEVGDILEVPMQKTAVGDSFDIDQIMLLKDDNTTTVGTPLIDGAKIEAKVVSNGKSDRITVYKFKRRTKYRRTQGHRQDHTAIKIEKIVSPS